MAPHVHVVLACVLALCLLACDMTPRITGIPHGMCTQGDAGASGHTAVSPNDIQAAAWAHRAARLPKTGL